MIEVINVENLSKIFKTRTNKNILTGIFNPKYRETIAVDNISLSIKKGESVAFLGPNGAGKTTSTKMLTGLLFPTNGTAKVLGFTPFERKREFLKQIGLVMGNRTGLSWDLSASQNFEMLKYIYQIDEARYKKTVSDLSNLLDVEKHLQKQIRKLSLGERMKIELISSILHEPKILFLDEPTIGLDITSKKNMRKFLREIQKNSDITLILTSHDMDDIEHVCDRVVVINKGKKVYDGDIKELASSYNEEKFIKVYFETKPQDVTKITGARVDRSDESSITFVVRKNVLPEFITTIFSNYLVLDLDIIGIPLEDIIEDIFRKSEKVASIL